MMRFIGKVWKPQLIYFMITVLVTTLLFTQFTANGETIDKIDFIGEATLPTGNTFQKTEVGGLSGITYDEKKQLYYSISDDRSNKAPARFYTLKIDLSKGQLQNSNVEVVGVKTLTQKDGTTFAANSIDPEAITLDNQTVYIANEGDTKKLINPSITEFSLADGQEVNTLPIPEKYLPDKNEKQGVRNNLAFESLTITPNKKYLYSATENALIQDGEGAKPNQGTACRILQYNLHSRQLEKEFVYITEPVKPLFNIAGKFASGLTDLLALDNNGHFISIERTFNGLGLAIALFQVSLENADDISNIPSITTAPTPVKPVEKKLLFDLTTLDVLLDNIEGLTYGPKLSSREQALILVSDNNFNRLQRTQILAFKVKVQTPLQRLLHRLTQPFKR